MDGLSTNLLTMSQALPAILNEVKDVPQGTPGKTIQAFPLEVIACHDYQDIITLPILSFEKFCL